MLKRKLIPKHLLGGPVARLSLQKSSGSWGNRGPGNEGLSFIENALYTIGDFGGLLTFGDKLLHPEKYEIKMDYGTPVEIDGKTVYPLAEPLELIGYPTLIPGLKGIPTKELTEFFNTKWGPAYNSLASTKSRLKNLGRFTELETSKPYIAFQKLNEQLKQMVDEANKNIVKPVINVIDETIEIVKPKLKDSSKYRQVVKKQKEQGLLGPRSKASDEANKVYQAYAKNNRRFINPGRPAVARTSEEVINTFKGWSNKSKGAANALRKYELKVAKGIDGEALRKARLECAREIMRNEPGSFTRKQREILGL